MQSHVGERIERSPSQPPPHLTRALCQWSKCQSCHPQRLASWPFNTHRHHLAGVVGEWGPYERGCGGKSPDLAAPPPPNLRFYLPKPNSSTSKPITAKNLDTAPTQSWMGWHFTRDRSAKKNSPTHEWARENIQGASTIPLFQLAIPHPESLKNDLGVCHPKWWHSR